MAYTRDRLPDVAEVIALYDRAALRRPTDDPARIDRMYAHADLVLCARDGERLVGVARTLIDWSHAGYLADLAVDPDYHRQGIGRELVRLTREALGPEVMLILLAAPTARDYYRRLGFDHADNCWTLPRER